MVEREGLVTIHGNPLTLVGPEIKPGDPAPDCELIDNDMKPVRIADYDGKVRVISVVPSLDTPVCDMQTRKFNEAAGNLAEDAVILTVSMDLPFAQKRWCGAAGVEQVVTLSDHRTAEFGQQYGVLIKELRLLARCVFVIDRKGTVRYVQLVSEVGNEPDYEKALEAVKEIV